MTASGDAQEAYNSFSKRVLKSSTSVCAYAIPLETTTALNAAAIAAIFIIFFIVVAFPFYVLKSYDVQFADGCPGFKAIRKRLSGLPAMFM
jgi:hypothetical protein